MIITKKYAQQLIREGRAQVEGYVMDDNRRYAIVTRYDLQRTDHYEEVAK